MPADAAAVAEPELREPLPRGHAALPPEAVAASQRRRLLRALELLAGSKGFAELTVADLTTTAGVGRNSFYALFKDKADCYLVAYRRNAAWLIDVCRRAGEGPADPVDGIVASLRAYLTALDASPVIARAFLVESLRAGSEAVTLRQELHGEFVDLFSTLYERAQARHPELAAISRSRFVALIGGVNELVTLELEGTTRAPDVAGLEPDVLDLAKTVLGLREEPCR
jgi:AcrR family transcriptional regulator